MSAPEERPFERGESVRHILTKEIGVVVGSHNWGTELDVEFFSDGGTYLRHGVADVMIERLPPVAQAKAGTGSIDQSDGDNVIPVDFTKRVKLTRKTKTRGTA